MSQSVVETAGKAEIIKHSAEAKILQWPVRKYEHSPEELIAVQNQILQELGHEPMIACGYFITVWVYETARDDGEARISYRDAETGEMKKSFLIAPEEATKREKWDNFVGKVVYVGDEAYTSGKFKNKDGVTRPWCKLGDWVTFPRHEGTLLGFKGKAMMQLPDDRILNVVPNPTEVSRFLD